MEDTKKESRDSLTALADKLPLYSRQIRDAGFSCCHIREDWIDKNCTKEDVAFHQRYLIEYAREALVSDSTSTILFTDEINCRSQWLNQLKARRLDECGPVDKLMSSSETRHLVELCPCLREFSRITESTSKVARKHDEAMVKVFVERWVDELKSHHDEIKRCVEGLAGQYDEASMQAFYAERVTEVFTPLGARMFHTVQMYGPAKAVSFNFREHSEFVLLPLITCEDKSGARVPSGKASMGFRLTGTDVLRAEKFEKSKYLVVNLPPLLPAGFVDYGRFNDVEDFCLNVLAWIAALRVLLPDILRTLKVV